MPEKEFVVAIDQGTTSSRALLYDLDGREVRKATRPLEVRFPRDGWVEQRPSDILQTQLDCLAEVTQGIAASRIAGLGITNQRETVVCWDRSTGEAIANAIVWQCRRSSGICDAWRESHEQLFRSRTGLTVDPYFSASKIRWLIDNDAEVADAVRAGRALFGTVDTWLIYKLTGGRSFLTEPSNASRTMLFDIEKLEWSGDLLKLCGIGAECLPGVESSSGYFGETVDGLPIHAVLGDQQASLYGHGCVEPGSVKCTFGTGAFMLINTGREKLPPKPGLLGTVAWQQAGGTIYACEGSVFVAGALIQWLRDKLGIISSSAQSEALARTVEDSGGVMVVPAFVGLGAPYWDHAARGSILGLTRDSSAAHIARASLEGVAHQVADLMEAEGLDGGVTLNIDGGMSANALFCQILADLCGVQVVVSPRTEVTAFGAAKMALHGSGVVSKDEAEAGERFRLEAGAGAREHFKPSLGRDVRSARRDGWKRAIERSRGWVN